MMHLITAANAGRHVALLESAWRLRHRHFVDRLGWEAIRRPDGREIDQFDTSNTIHFALDVGGQAQAYARWLPTTGPHLLSHVYPELMDGAPYPRGEDIWEWTRSVAEPGAVGRGGVSAAHLLNAGIAEAFLRLGLRGLIVQCHPKLVTLLLETGWEVSPLNVPRTYQGAPVAVILVAATSETIRTMQALWRMREAGLSIEPALANPIHRSRSVLTLADALRTAGREVYSATPVRLTI